MDLTHNTQLVVLFKKILKLEDYLIKQPPVGKIHNSLSKCMHPNFFFSNIERYFQQHLLPHFQIQLAHVHITTTPIPVAFLLAIKQKHKEHTLQVKQFITKASLHKKIHFPFIPTQNNKYLG